MYHDEHERKALNALAADMGLHDGANRDAALGLPLVMLGSDATDRLNTLTENGTKPGATTASRTDAASLSELRARRQACRVVESAAWNALLESGLTQEQLVLLGAYNDSVHETRRAELDVHFAVFTNGCLLYTSPSPRDGATSRMPSSA